MIEETESAEEIESKETKTPQEDPDLERAKSQGWKPKEEWKGDPGKWSDYKEFLRIGDEFMPVMRERSRKMETELSELRSTMRELVSMHREQTERAVQEAVEKLQKERSDAILEADIDKVHKYDEKIEKLRTKHEQDAPIPPKATREIEEWAENNPWFADSEYPELRQLAIGVYEREGRRNPDKTDREILKVVTSEVKKRFPEHFSNPRRDEAASVEGGSAPRKAKTSRGYDELPAEARAICDKLVKSKAMTKEQYVKDYFE